MSVHTLSIFFIFFKYFFICLNFIASFRLDMRRVEMPDIVLIFGRVFSFIVVVVVVACGRAEP